jgi:hypothetical protein
MSSTSAYLALSHLAIAPRGTPRDPIEQSADQASARRRITLACPT